jgi:hypothetical protein
VLLNVGTSNETDMAVECECVRMDCDEMQRKVMVTRVSLRSKQHRVILAQYTLQHGPPNHSNETNRAFLDIALTLHVIETDAKTFGLWPW